MFKAQAVILAGGQGLRLRPYTTVVPKPLLPLHDKPILEIIIRQLKYHGFRRIVISTGYLAELIEVYFGSGEKWGVDIRYVREKVSLGTAGALKLVRHVEKDFLVINGDVLTDMRFSDLLTWHIRCKATGSIAVKERKIKSDFGEISIAENNEMKAYLEKPEHSSFVSMGVNILHESARSFMAKGENIGMPDLMMRLSSAGKKVCCYKVKDLWLDLGRLEDFQIAQEIFSSNQKRFLPKGLCQIKF